MALPSHMISPRKTDLQSPGLSLRTGKTPRPPNPEERTFAFSDSPVQTDVDREEEKKLRIKAPSSPSQVKSLLISMGITMLMIVGVIYSGNTGNKWLSVAENGPKRGLRGGEATETIITDDGTKIVTHRVSHHKPRVIMVPSLEPFQRRNTHHYKKHDAQGKLVTNKEHRQAQAVHVDDIDTTVDDRRAPHAVAEAVMKWDDSASRKVGFSMLPPPFTTSGVVRKVESITGVDKYHKFDVNDYFGSSITKMGAKDSITTLAVGAPGALDNSGVIYFMSLNSNGTVAGYSYLTNADDFLGQYWAPNVALGWAVENIGDVDGDGVDDLAVGAIGYPHGSSLGAVYILFLTPTNEIKSYRVITAMEAGFTAPLKENSCFGSSITRLGDLDGDGVTEIAVGAMGMGKQRGGVFILFLNKDGSVKKYQQISSMQGWEHKLNVEDQFGHAVRMIGDLDGDGVPDLAVGADGFPSGEFYGTVYILFMKKDGTIKKWRRLDELDGILEPEYLFGGSIDVMGDLDGDGLPELLVGAPGAEHFKGNVMIISLRNDGTAKAIKSIVDDLGPLQNEVVEDDEFGWSLCSIGDLDGDGISELAVGAEVSPADKNYGSVHVLFLEPQESQ